MAELKGLKVIDRTNCAIDQEQLFLLPPMDGQDERGWNILHFNSSSRHYRNNTSSAELVRNVLEAQDPPAEALQSDCAIMQFAVALSRERNPDPPAPGTERVFIELGFCAGRSLNFMAALGYDREVYGFDSCQGLPRTWRPGFEQGTFRFLRNARNEPAPDSDFVSDDPFIPFIPLANTKLIIGQLEDTLPVFCPQVLGDKGRLELLHVDTDTHGSAHNAFDVLAPYIQPSRTVIVLDEGYNYFSKENTLNHAEWKQGEFKAVQELARRMGELHGSPFGIHYHAFNEMHQQLVLTIEPLD